MPSRTSPVAGEQTAAQSSKLTPSPTASSSSPSPSPSSSTVSLENEALVQSLAATESRLPAPIDIDVNRARQITLAPLRWANYGTPPATVTLTNTGETVMLSGRWADGKRPSVRGGALGESRYAFSQLHFHWGRTALDGSEHTVDGCRLPLELHVVHFDERWGDQEAALRVPGGVLCVVYFYRLQSTPSRFFAPLVAGLRRVPLAGSHAKLEPFPLDELVHTFDDEYFLYWGCTRGGTRATPQDFPMLWMLSRAQERLDFRQLKHFNRLLDARMRPNRPLEPSTPVAPTGRHLFHVNPRTPMVLATLMLEPPPKYMRTRWLVDRHPVDWSSPEACRQYVRMVREELARKRKQQQEEGDENGCPDPDGTV